MSNGAFPAAIWAGLGERGAWGWLMIHANASLALGPCTSEGDFEL